MAKFMKSVLHPIGNLFSRPKSVFGKSSNWIADWAAPMVLGSAGWAGPALAGAYGGWRGYSQKAQQTSALNRDLRGAGQPEVPGAGLGDIGWGAATGLMKGYGGRYLGSGGTNTSLSMLPSMGKTGAAVATGAGAGADAVKGAYGGILSGGQAPGADYAANVAAAGAAGKTWGAGGGDAITSAASGLGASSIQNILKGIGIGGEGGAANNWIGPLLAGGGAMGSLTKDQPDFSYYDATERMEQARNSVMSKYLGEAGAQLPSVVAENYLEQIQTPLGQLYPVEKDARWGRVQEQINTSYDDYEKSIQARYSQAGGLNSSDYKEEVRNAKADRAKELSQSRQEIESSAYKTQVEIKQNALLQSTQQNQWDEKLALELATGLGRDQEMMMAIQAQDYEAFQNVMSELMSAGLADTLYSRRSA